MAFRGRGRGRGGGGGFRFAKQEKFALFPQEIEGLPDAKGVKEEVSLLLWSFRLQSFWNSSAYYLKDEGSEKDESLELEKLFDMGRQGTKQKVELSDFMKCSIEYVPAELADRKPEQVRRWKVRWNQESDFQKLDMFEKREQKSQGQNEKDLKEKKEDKIEEEEDERIEDEDEEFSGDDDYNQNIDFDDDEDDFNMDDDNNDEGEY